MILHMQKILEYYGDMNEEIMQDVLDNFPEATIIDTFTDQISVTVFNMPEEVKKFREKFNL